VGAPRRAGFGALCGRGGAVGAALQGRAWLIGGHMRKLPWSREPCGGC
jgi:hypothetical protein